MAAFVRRGCRIAKRAGLAGLNTRLRSLETGKTFIRAIAHSRVCFSNEDGIFPGASSKFTSLLDESRRSHEEEPRPTYRVMDTNGVLLDSSQDPGFSDETLLKMYEKMILQKNMDLILNESQRQGRISFYMPASGEEGTHYGSAVALDVKDVVFAQYRELGLLLWRGYTLEQCLNQCYGNHLDPGQGKQMPVHYGSKELGYFTISSPLATQMPQASGYAYALKRSGTQNCVICFFGDGAAQEGDAHAALNFAATLDCPILFFCRNNGYAISTPTSEQYRGDGIVSRGIGYGMESIRVDGNDTFAVYNVVKYAKNVAISESRPVLIEAMTYRLGNHSTSDDSTAYRSKEEIDLWQKGTAIERLKLHMIGKGIWSEKKEKEFNAEVRKNIIAASSEAEKILKAGPETLFDDVYKELPQSLKKQKEEMLEHIKKYPDHYPQNVYWSSN